MKKEACLAAGGCVLGEELEVGPSRLQEPSFKAAGGSVHRL